MTFNNTALLATAAISLSGPAISQEQSAAGQAQTGEAEIIVTGFAKPYKLTGRQLARAQTAYNAKRGQLAPQSQLYFQVTPKNGGDISDLDLYLKQGDEIVSLPLDGQRRFVLPPLNGRD